MGKFHERAKRHDAFEEKVMNELRKHSSRKHLPDRWISFGGNVCALDIKTTVFVEDNSHDEYFRLYNEDEIPVFIVYYDKSKDKTFMEWIHLLTWKGPFEPSKNSTSGDHYYIISGGREKETFLANVSEELETLTNDRPNI